MKKIGKLESFLMKTMSFAYTPFKKHSATNYELTKKERLIGKLLITSFYSGVGLVAIVFLLPTIFHKILPMFEFLAMIAMSTYGITHLLILIEELIIMNKERKDNKLIKPIDKVANNTPVISGANKELTLLNEKLLEIKNSKEKEINS